MRYEIRAELSPSCVSGAVDMIERTLCRTARGGYRIETDFDALTLSQLTPQTMITVLNLLDPQTVDPENPPGLSMRISVRSTGVMR